VTVSGTLQTVDGKPVALQAGEVTKASDEKPLTFFTNREGKFYLEGLKSGSYTLRMHADESIVTRFEIPSHKHGLYEIGTLRLAEKMQLD